MSQSKLMMQVLGLSIVTTNQEAFQHNSIGKLWEKFKSTPLHEQIKNIASNKIFAVYSDYEKADQGKYRLTVGFAVSEANSIPEGLTLVQVPEGKYQAFPCKSQAPQDIVDTWKTIWARDALVHKRSYTFDFEEYVDDKVSIHIGYE